MTDMIKVRELRAHTFATHTHGHRRRPKKVITTVPQWRGDDDNAIESDSISFVCAHAANEWFSCFCSHNKFVWRRRESRAVHWQCFELDFSFPFRSTGAQHLKCSQRRRLAAQWSRMSSMLNVHVAATREWKTVVWKRKRDVSFRKVPSIFASVTNEITSSHCFRF